MYFFTEWVDTIVAASGLASQPPFARDGPVINFHFMTFSSLLISIRSHQSVLLAETLLLGSNFPTSAMAYGWNHK